MVMGGSVKLLTNSEKDPYRMDISMVAPYNLIQQQHSV